MSRLSYCTERGGYQEIPFDITPDHARFFTHAMSLIDGEIDRGFLPAAPQAGACAYVRLSAGLRPQRRAAHSRKQNRDAVGRLASAEEHLPMIPAIQTDDAAARERIRNSLGESLIVEASAGTGKTSELIRRIVRVLAAGTPVQTDRGRHVHPQSRRRVEDPAARGTGQSARRVRRCGRARLYLEDALERLEEAAIGTIHGFCAQILRERPVEARIDPGFEELTEPEADRLCGRAFDAWFQQKLDAGSAPPCAGRSRAWPGASPGKRADSRRWSRSSMRASNWWNGAITCAPWRREPFDRGARMDALMHAIARWHRRPGAPMSAQRATTWCARCARCMDLREQAVRRRHAGSAPAEARCAI